MYRILFATFILAVLVGCGESATEQPATEKATPGAGFAAPPSAPQSTINPQGARESANEARKDLNKATEDLQKNLNKAKGN